MVKKSLNGWCKHPLRQVTHSTEDYMETVRTCQICNTALRYQKKFCSPECLAKSLKKISICELCSKEYNPIRKGSRFCSLVCFNANRVKSKHQNQEPDPIPGARFIPLTQGKFAIVDESKYEELSKINWCAVKVKSETRGTIYYAKSIEEYMHRYILKPRYGMEVDHIDNTLDNRLINLRVVHRSKNQMNRFSSVRVGRTSIYKGVSKSKLSKKWVVSVMSDGGTHHVGYFEDEIEAAKAYDSMARVYQGSYARLNFPNIDVGERSAISGKVRES
jgi:hypothetical protein